MPRPALLTLLALAALLATPSGRLAASDAPPRLSILCTVGMITDIVSAVAADRATVEGLMGEGVDPHLYKPTRSDIGRLMAADIVFYNGLLLEGKMTDAFVRAASAGRKVFPVTELLDERFLLEPPEFQGHYDPHVWMDPTAWRRAVEVVRDRLAAIDPAGAALYQSNSERYLTELDRLDDYCRRVLAAVPPRQRVLVTAHDAFNYFGRRFGFEVVGIQGISTESEAGVRDIERIVNLLVSREIKAVFVESTVSDRNVKALIAGAAARGHAVAIGGTLFSDAMGAPGTYEGTYLGMIDHNATTIARALGGPDAAPALGMQDRLTPPPTPKP